jgi:hypothetical protein
VTGAGKISGTVIMAGTTKIVVDPAAIIFNKSLLFISGGFCSYRFLNVDKPKGR